MESGKRVPKHLEIAKQYQDHLLLYMDSHLFHFPVSRLQNSIYLVLTEPRDFTATPEHDVSLSGMPTWCDRLGYLRVT
jgi:hypothetical protein